MVLAVDISDDFLMVDGLSSVSVRPPVRENINPELLVNGIFNTGIAGWTSNSFEWLGDDGNVAISEAGPSSHIGQSFATTVGLEYIVEFDLYSPTFNTDVAVWLGTTIDDDQIVYLPIESGHHRFTFNALNATTWIRLQSQNIIARYDNVSVRRSGASSLTKALRRMISTREMAASKGQYRQGDVRWHLHYSELAVPPSIGAVIVDSSTVEWTVLAVDNAAFGTRWVCHCRNSQVAAIDENIVAIYKAGFSKGESGTEKPAWVSFAAQVRARVQRQDVSTPETENQLRFTPTPVEIFCKHKFPVDHRFKVIDSYGQEYKILGTRYNDDLGNPFTIVAESIPWPLA